MHTHPLIIDLAVAERRARLVGDGPTWGRPIPPARPRRLLAGPVVMAALALGTVGLLAACEPLPPPLCAGDAPTIVGTPGDDSIQGTPGVDVIAGLGGNDTIHGSFGDDVICGGDGADRVFGDNGEDVVNGDAGSDVVEGNLGNDIVADSGTDARDTNRFSGGLGNDLFIGGPGKDLVVYTDAAQGVTVDLVTKRASGAGDDVFQAGIDGAVGSTFADSLTGDDARNSLDGQGGDDVIGGRKGDDNLIGGPGMDRVSYITSGRGVIVDLAARRSTGDGTDTLTGFENVGGSNAGDDLRGDAGPNVIDAGRGNDSCTGNGGADVFISCP